MSSKIAISKFFLRSDVVYFDQRMGALHAVCWSSAGDSSFSEPPEPGGCVYSINRINLIQIWPGLIFCRFGGGVGAR